MTSFNPDTNILFYAFDTRDQTKHNIANRIVSFCLERKAQIAIQVLAELHYAAVRKNIVPPLQADAIVRDFMQRMPVLSTSSADLTTALNLRRQYNLQLFDCVILAVTSRAQCTHFLSEDLQHGQQIDQMTILNPFLLTPTALDALLT